MERENAFGVYVGGGGGRRSLGRPMRRWSVIIKYLKEIRMVGVDCIYLAQDSDKWRAVVNTVGNSGFHKLRGILWVAENIQFLEEGIFGFS